jgi:CBS domain-containing protein
MRWVLNAPQTLAEVSLGIVDFPEKTGGYTMSDNAQDPRLQDAGGAGDSGGRSIGRGGGARRGVLTGGGAPPEEVAVDGSASRHLHEAAGAAMRRATTADDARGVGESMARHLQDVAMHLATAMQESAHDMQTLFALRAPDSEHLRDLGESVSTVAENMLRSNARMMQELFRMTSPAAAIDLQRRCASEYLDTTLHNVATLFRAVHRSADLALRPLEAHAARRRQRHAAPASGRDESQERVADMMRTAPPVVGPDDTVQRAVQLMRQADLGGLPVRDGDRLIGMVTDRDIALRLVAEARDPTQARVRDVMTPDVPFVFEDDTVEHVAEEMAGQRLRRLPVLNREKRLVGVISLVDLARKDHDLPTGVDSGSASGDARVAA